MSTDDQMIGLFIKRAHPNVDGFSVLAPSDAPKGYPARRGGFSLAKPVPVEITRGEFDALPEFTE